MTLWGTWFCDTVWQHAKSSPISDYGEWLESFLSNRTFIWQNWHHCEEVPVTPSLMPIDVELSWFPYSHLLKNQQIGSWPHILLPSSDAMLLLLIHWGKDKMATIFQMTLFKHNIFIKNYCILAQISLKYVPKAWIINMPALFQIMVQHPTGKKPLSEPKVAEFTDAYMRHSASMI